MEKRAAFALVASIPDMVRRRPLAGVANPIVACGGIPHFARIPCAGPQGRDEGKMLRRALYPIDKWPPHLVYLSAAETLAHQRNLQGVVRPEMDVIAPVWIE